MTGKYPDFGNGAVALLDGGTGTELQRRVVPMTTQAWCGPAALDHVATLEQVHRDYIAAGADIVTANTYASARHLLAQDGFGDQFEPINRAAVRAARAARDAAGRPDVLVAGSLSHRGPIATGTAVPAGGATDPAEMAASVRELAWLLREAGCDLILLEMMYDPARMPAVFEAASEAGLPVWAGFSARRAANGRVVGFDPGQDIAFADVVSELSHWEISAAGVMHTAADVVSDALAILRAQYSGPLMAYPDSGFFKSPHWQFEDVMSPDDLHAFAAGWIADGAQVIGGCCGLSPEHIAALAPLRRDPEAFAASPGRASR